MVSSQSDGSGYCPSGAPKVRKPPAPKGASAKKVKKRNPWSEDEFKSESELEENEPIIPRETKSQRASGKHTPESYTAACNTGI